MAVYSPLSHKTRVGWRSEHGRPAVPALLRCAVKFEESINLLPMYDDFEGFAPKENPVEYIMSQFGP